MEGFQSVKYFVGAIHDVIVKLIPTKTSELTNDSNYATTDVATQDKDGLMSKEDKAVVDKFEKYLTSVTWGDLMTNFATWGLVKDSLNS